MVKENFSELSTEDLSKKKKTMTFTIGLWVGALNGLIIITVFHTINKGFTPALVIPFALLPVFVISYSRVKSINKELKSRKSN